MAGLTGVAGALRWGVIVLTAAILLAHAFLLPLGRWQGDEYILAYFAHLQGFDYYLERITGFSPRPMSEAVLYGYFRLVVWLGRPLIQPLLLLHWVALAASCAVTMRWRNGPASSWRILTGTSLLCFFVLGHDVTELFFWPAGVAPYLETLSATTLLLFLTVDGRLQSRAGMRVAVICLIVSATASESGAMFVLPYAALQIFSARGGRLAWGWAIPLAVAIAVLAAIVFSPRLRAGEVVGPAAVTMHQPLASLVAALPEFGRELIGLDTGDLTLNGALAGAGIKLLVFFALRWCWRLGTDAPPPPGLAAFVIAALAGAFATIVAAEFQFGTICCSRHGSLRQCWFFAAIAALAAWRAPMRAGAPARIGAPMLLAAALVWALLPRLPGLISDYRLRDVAIMARAETWRSGFAPGSSMLMILPPEGQVVHGSGLSTGHYTAQDTPLLWWIRGILLFFNKQTVDIRPSGA